MGATIEALETQVQELGGKKRSREDKKITGKTVLYERAHELEEHVENMYDKKDLPCLFLKVLKWLSDSTIDLRMKLREYNEFKPILAVIHAERDASSAKYLRENVYNDEAFGLLRLCVNLSKRECGLVQQSFKYRRDALNQRRRTRMNSDSATPAPELFPLLGIDRVEKAAEKSSGVEMEEQTDRRGANVSGPFGVDQCLFNSIEATKKDRTGGMATKGDKDDPHLMNITGDGAGLSAAFTGVRVSVFPGTTEMLNQSSNDVTDLLIFQV